MVVNNRYVRCAVLVPKSLEGLDGLCLPYVDQSTSPKGVVHEFVYGQTIVIRVVNGTRVDASYVFNGREMHVCLTAMAEEKDTKSEENDDTPINLEQLWSKSLPQIRDAHAIKPAYSR